MTKRMEEKPVGRPRDEYSRRLDARRAILARMVRLERLIADSRLVVFLAGLTLSWLVFGTGQIPKAWLWVPFGLFVALAIGHERIKLLSQRASRAVVFYEKGLARLEHRWAGTGESGERYLDSAHPYAADLDLFGSGSLYERLCTARTRVGKDTLASWLLRPAGEEVIHERQTAVAELLPRLDLREELELLGSEVGPGIDPESLAAWGSEPRVFAAPMKLAAVAALLTAFALAGLVGWFALDTGPSPFFAVVIAEMIFARSTSKRVGMVTGALDRRTHDLILLSAVLSLLERERFKSPSLCRLRLALETDGELSSRRIAKLGRLFQLLQGKENQFFAPMAAILLWSLQLSVAIDMWRASSGPSVSRWLAAVGEFEALCALAAYAWECPGDVFPEIVPAGAIFEAERVGHPLIPEQLCVRNDLALGGERRVLVVSGSNMSGKSTLLRTVAINSVLALAGAPVRAGRLRITPLAIGATLRIQDSLQAGRSRFFAEIIRIRQLVDLSRGPLPLLFLLDEVFHGTNSHDRRLGAEAVVRGFIEHGAIGLITTHDLALTSIVERLAPHAENVHFEDQFENGIIEFDYRMRSGIVQHSNALALMRAVGLEV